MPQVSAEMRWFLEATNSTDVKTFDSWFKSGSIPPGGGKKVRKDVYAVDPSTDELGVKNREGKPGLEVKALVEPRFLSLEFGTRKAIVQLWSKVTSNVVTLPVGVTAKRTTLKTRWLRMFDTVNSDATEVKLGGGPFGEDPAQASPPDLGCNVEWTLVEVPSLDAQWWTFGFEAFAFNQAGPIFPRLEEGLRRTLSALETSFASAPNLGNVWREQSYPAWIRQQ
ncbi:MAG: hypothetical protein ACXW6J_17850 [Candidatus Binatia bacterium]